MNRKAIWTDERCKGCGRLPYTRRDGTEYLYQYREHGPAVCSPRCDRKCDCEAPEPKNNAALVSDSCPIHG